MVVGVCLLKLLGLLGGVLSRRLWLFVLLNTVFFGGLFVAALASKGPYLSGDGWDVEGDLFVTFLSIFISNVAVSGFLLLTVSGLVFFAVPVGILVWRAALWGILLNGLSTPAFLAALPTVLLEGEGYVIAGVAGVILGLSWLQPNWIGMEKTSRQKGLRQGVKECAYLYVLVVILLLAAAAVETFTLSL